MSARCIVLPSGQRCGLGIYVAAWKRILAIPAEERARVSVGPSWSWTDDSAEWVLRSLRDGLHDRINRHVPSHGRGRKWSSDWQRDARHTANAVNHPRLIVHAMSVSRHWWPRLRDRMTFPGEE